MVRTPNERSRTSPPPRRDGRAGPLAQAKGSGSGFFVTTDGHLLTSFHVVAQASRIVIATKAGRFPARVLAGDADNDLALLKASVQSRPLPLANSRAVALGETVFTIGFPVPAIQGIEPKLTDGRISSLAGPQDDPRYFQTSVAVQPGNSGGPLVDQASNVVGIVTMRLDDLKTWKLTSSLPQNVNYALKSSGITGFLENRPEVRNNRRGPYLSRDRRFEEVVKEAQEAVALVLVY
jgi:serine protease Do